MTSSVQNAWVELAHELGPDFRERAATLDLQGRFAADNYRELQARRAMSAGVPESLGGGGASHRELCDFVRTLAHYCPSTALALSMHTHLVAAAVWRQQHGQDATALLRKVAEHQAVLVSTGAGDWTDSHGQVERVDGGYRISAKKRFASGCPAGAIAVSSAPYDDPQQGPEVLHFAVPLDSEGVRLGDDWDTLGMRATGSHTLHFERVFVPDAAVALRRPRGPWHKSWSVVVTVAVPIYTAVYVGLAERAAELAIESARRNATEPLVQYQVGELDNQLQIAQMSLRDMIESARNYDVTPDVQAASRTLRCKTLATQAVQRAVDQAVELTGGGAFFRKHPLERLWRDAQAAQFHPLPEAKQRVFSGRVTLGLSPV